MIRTLAAPAAVLALSLAGCAGGGPLGTGLGEVVANIAVTDGKGSTCNVSVTNGKDQTGLTLKGLHVCGGSLDELHADKSDGAAAAIAANAAVANHAIDVGGGLANAGIGLATKAAGLPVAPPLPEPAAATPTPAPPDPLLEPGRWYAGLRPYRRFLEGVDHGAVCYRTGEGAEHCASVHDWLRWVVRPLPAPRT